MNKLSALPGQGLAHSEIGQSVNCRELKFHDRVVIPFDNGDGKIWFTADTLAGLLGYADKDKVLNLYYRHADEFTPSMTIVTKVRVCNENKELQHTQVRLFSPRGAHLIGMFARTKVAKELRVWLLDLVEKETGINISPLSIEQLAQLTGQQLHDYIESFDKASFKYRGQKGSGLMAQRKRDIKNVGKATVYALRLTQMIIPDLGEFPEELS